MVKPIYLYDILRNDFLEVPSDQQQRTMGRSIGCDLVTDASEGGIDKYQAQIQYFPNGDIRLTQLSSLSPTHWSENGNDWEQLYTGRTELMLPGYHIMFDESYIIRVFAHNSREVQERMALRDAEVRRDD